MSLNTKQMIDAFTIWMLRIFASASVCLVVWIFLDLRTNVQSLRTEVNEMNKDLQKDVNEIKNRVTRVETKLEN